MGVRSGPEPRRVHIILHVHMSVPSAWARWVYAADRSHDACTSSSMFTCPSRPRGPDGCTQRTGATTRAHHPPCSHVRPVRVGPIGLRSGPEPRRVHIILHVHMSVPSAWARSVYAAD